MASELTTLKASLERLAAERTEIVQKLDLHVLAIFELVSRRRNGIAVAEALGRSCRRGRTITYAELARGVTFRLPEINGGRPYVIDILNQTQVSKRDQHILDDFLCFLSLQSMKGASILASANVFDPNDSRGASNGFFETARLLGVLTEVRGDMGELMFWKRELQKVHDWFSELPPAMT